MDSSLVALELAGLCGPSYQKDITLGLINAR